MMLKKIIQAVFIFGLLASQICLAQYPMAWLVEKNAVSFWVYGLAHSIPEEYGQPPVHMQTVFAEARIVIPESYTAGAKVDLPQLTAQERDLSSPYFEQLAKDRVISWEWADRLRNLPTYELYEQLQPLLATVRISTTQKSVEGYDAFFARKAYAENPKKLDQLEDRSRRKIAWSKHCGGTENYLKMIRAIDYELRFPQKMNRIMPQILEASLMGNFDSYTKIRADIEQDVLWQMIVDCSVIPRNHEWAQRIHMSPEKFDKSMILVGDSHVVGKDNFIDLLRQHGFKATYFKPK